MGRAGADREVVLEECSPVKGFWDEHRHDDGLSWNASWNAPRPENSGSLPGARFGGLKSVPFGLLPGNAWGWGLQYK